MTENQLNFFSRKIKRTILWLSFFSLLFLLLSSILVPQWQKWSLKSHGPLGALYEVNGRQMHLYCIGEGGPTVLLSADILGGTLSWYSIQNELAKTVRVCSYDRSGTAWSESSELEENFQSMAADLNALLNIAGETGPYILVGHGFGGSVLRSFVVDYPESVAALVLLDSQARDVMKEFMPEYLDKLEKFDQIQYQEYKNQELLAQLGLLKFLPNKNSPSASSEINTLLKNMQHRDYWAVVLNEWKLWQDSKNQLSNDPLILGEKPLVILAADYLENEWVNDESINSSELYEAQLRAQEELLRLSYNNSLVVLKGVGHNIPFLAPQEVIDGILRILANFQTEVSLPNDNGDDSELVEIEI